MKHAGQKWDIMINIYFILKSKVCFFVRGDPHPHKWKTRTWTWPWCDLISRGQVCDLCWDPPCRGKSCSQSSHTLSTTKTTVPPTSPHPTLPRGFDWKPNMQILPVQTGWGTDDSNNDTFLLLSFPLFSPSLCFSSLLVLHMCCFYC